jgi:DNA-binding MarR family transcriptional regulator
MGTETRPIGYWLKQLDGLIDAEFDAIFSEQHVSRRQWQVLNLLHRKPANEREIKAALRPFWTEDGVTQAEVVAELVRRQWIEGDNSGRHRISVAGQIFHAAIAAKVEIVRRKVVYGLSQEEYDTLINTLRRMSANLDPLIQ